LQQYLLRSPHHITPLQGLSHHLLLPVLCVCPVGLSLIALDQNRNKRIEPAYRNMILVM
jgi:hypothetical protein